MAVLNAIDDPTGVVGDTFGNRTIVERYAAGRFRFEDIPATSGIPRVLYPTDYGAVVNSPDDQTAAFQAWADAMAAQSTADNSGVWGIVPPGVWRVNGSVTLPDCKNGFSIFGYGAKLDSNVGAPIFKNETTPDNIFGTIQGRNNRTIQGFEFNGDNIAGSVGIHLESCGRIRIRDCRFNEMDIGIDGGFLLNSYIGQCEFSQCGSYGIRLEDGVGRWAGASSANTAPNVNTIDQCRVSCLAGSVAAFSIKSGGGCVIRDCVAEGGDPSYNVYCKNSTNTSALAFDVQNIHCENSPTVAHVYLSTLAHADISFGHLIGNSVYVDASESISAATIKVKFPFGATVAGGTSPKFKNGSAVRWIFDNCGSSGGIDLDPADPDNWVNADVPAQGARRTIGYSTQTPALRRSVTTATYELTAEDMLSDVMIFTHDAAQITVTLPDYLTDDPIDDESEITLHCIGDSGLTVDHSDWVGAVIPQKTIAKGERITLRKWTNNTWLAHGGTST